MTPERPFTAEVDDYVVLLLELDAYRGGERLLPEGYELLAEGQDITAYRSTEKRLLKKYFLAWRKPYRGRLDGFCAASPVFAVHRDRLVCGVYLVAANELGKPGWGQLHYAFIDPGHQGRGLYSAVFRQAVERARRWGLSGLVLNSDRHLLPEVYLRWGAVPLHTLRKGPLRRLLRRLLSLLR